MLIITVGYLKAKLKLFNFVAAHTKLFNMQEFKIIVDDKEYNIVSIDEKDQILYEVHDNDLLCVVGLNEDANWEANTNLDETLVAKIGQAIELKEVRNSISHILQLHFQCFELIHYPLELHHPLSSSYHYHQFLK